MRICCFGLELNGRKIGRFLTNAAVILSLCWAGRFTGLAEEGRKGATQLLLGARSKPMSLRVFDTVWESVRKDYYDSTLKGVDWEELRGMFRPQAAGLRDEKELYRLLERMLDKLKDGHTSVDSPAQMVREKRQQRFGLGITSEIIDSQFILTRVAKGSAADEAGIQPGWIMTHWNGTPMDLSKSRKPTLQLGQTVRFRFLDSDDHEQEVDLVARPFKQISARKAVLLDERLLYVRVDGFDRGIGKWFCNVMDRNLQTEGCIIDLRGSPGGFFMEMRDCLQPFYEEKTEFGESVQRNGKRIPLMVPGRGTGAYKGEVVVLTDRNSYSAAEVFAAAMKDSGRATIVGRKSGGVALLALHRRLPDGGEVSVSFRDYFRSNGARIEGAGVEPDIVVKKNLGDMRRNMDRDLERAFDLLGHSAQFSGALSRHLQP